MKWTFMFCNIIPSHRRKVIPIKSMYLPFSSRVFAIAGSACINLRSFKGESKSCPQHLLCGSPWTTDEALEEASLYWAYVVSSQHPWASATSTGWQGMVQITWTENEPMPLCCKWQNELVKWTQHSKCFAINLWEKQPRVLTKQQKAKAQTGLEPGVTAENTIPHNPLLESGSCCPFTNFWANRLLPLRQSILTATQVNKEMHRLDR